MKRRLLIASIFAFSLLALALIGPDAPADDPQAAGDPQPPATQTPEESEPLETFEPTEKLAAESAVAFPVDI